MDRTPVETDWSLSCSLCHYRFLTSQSTINAEGFIICPQCRQWSGHEVRERRLRPARCDVFTESQDRFVSDLWVWVTVNPKTTLEGLCGVMIDQIPRRAIADSFAEAMKFLPFIERIAKLSGRRFKLVKFAQAKVVAEI